MGRFAGAEASSISDLMCSLAIALSADFVAVAVSIRPQADLREQLLADLSIIPPLRLASCSHKRYIGPTGFA